MRIINPLPQKYLTQTTGVGGRIKVRPEDFLVDEVPLYEPEGEGEHLYLCIQKSNVSHGEMMSCLRRHFKVRERAIGFAGMKDKVGVTRQMVSIHQPAEPIDLNLPHDRMNVLWSAWHRNKLRLGHLAGNRFSIRIRDTDPLKAPLALRTLRILEREGVPNYFGSQRFGYRRNNHMLGARYLVGDWRGLLANLLGTAGAPFPEYQRERRELFDAGRYEEAAAMWSTSDRAERIASTALAGGASERDACLAVGHTALAFWVSALQSAMFNRVLDRRLEADTLTTLLEGDLAFRHDNRAVFAVTAEELATGELPQRLAAMEISPSGPMWGKAMMQAGGAVAEIEREALDAIDIPAEAVLAGDRSPDGGRRPLRVPIRNASLDAGIDEHGPYIRLAFDLPRGAYATIVLREIMKNDEGESDS